MKRHEAGICSDSRLRLYAPIHAGRLLLKSLCVELPPTDAEWEETIQQRSHLSSFDRESAFSVVKSGTKTLRFKADGRACVEDVDDTMVKAIDRINGLLETYMGINDSDLGKFII